MSRDYKPTNNTTKSSSKGNPLFTGLLIGVLIGIGVSLAVVMTIKGSDSPFNNNTAAVAQDPNKYDDLGKPDNAAAKSAEAAAEDDKTRFDFYTILPGTEKQITTDEMLKAEENKPATQGSYYLQVGAFQTEEDADNMKAKLALQGFEAVVQTATIPEKGVWHRVRVGPLNDLDQINKAKSDLAVNGFKADLIKVSEGT